MKTQLALSLLVLVCLAAAPASKPSLPPLNFKPKADAPGWVTESLLQYEKVRQKHAKEGPDRIAKAIENLDSAERGKIDPRIRVDLVRGKPNIYKSQEAKDKAIKGARDVLAAFNRSYEMVMNPDMLPAGQQPAGDKPLTEYVVSVDPAYKGTPKQPEKR